MNDLAFEARAVAAYQMGFPIRAIVEEQGTCFGTIRTILLRHGVQLRGRGGQLRCYREAREARTYPTVAKTVTGGAR